jgi:hypothetical protein
MNRDIPPRTLAVLAFSLALASIFFGWRWAQRQTSRIEREHRSVAAIESRQESLEHNMLNLGALLFRTTCDEPDAARPRPSSTLFLPLYEDLASSLPAIGSLEAARADEFLIWYLTELQRRHVDDGRSTHFAKGGNAR